LTNVACSGSAFLPRPISVATGAPAKAPSTRNR
jgi:hypothetical protein